MSNNNDDYDKNNPYEYMHSSEIMGFVIIIFVILSIPVGIIMAFIEHNVWIIFSAIVNSAIAGMVIGAGVGYIFGRFSGEVPLVRLRIFRDF